jgi:prefoldin subunit 5
MMMNTEHRDAGWLAQLAEKDRQIQALHEQLGALRGKSITFDDVFSRVDDAQVYCREQKGPIGVNVWHFVLDDAINLRRQVVALQAAYEDTRDSLQRALAALAEHDARYRQQLQAKASEYHNLPGWP